MFVGIRITVTNPKEAVALLAQFRAYPYAQRANPPTGKIVAPQGKRWSGSFATPAAANGSLFFRTESSLFAIGGRK